MGLVYLWIKSIQVPKPQRTDLTNGKKFEHQGYYRDNRRNMIPLNELREHCTLVDFEFDANEFEGDFI